MMQICALTVNDAVGVASYYWRGLPLKRAGWYAVRRVQSLSRGVHAISEAIV
jgi:hypothetical protein